MSEALAAAVATPHTGSLVHRGSQRLQLPPQLAHPYAGVVQQGAQHGSGAHAPASRVRVRKSAPANGPRRRGSSSGPAPRKAPFAGQLANDEGLERMLSVLASTGAGDSAWEEFEHTLYRRQTLYEPQLQQLRPLSAAQAAPQLQQEATQHQLPAEEVLVAGSPLSDVHAVSSSAPSQAGVRTPQAASPLAPSPLHAPVPAARPWQTPGARAAADVLVASLAATSSSSTQARRIGRRVAQRGSRRAGRGTGAVAEATAALAADAGVELAAVEAAMRRGSQVERTATHASASSSSRAVGPNVADLAAAAAAGMGPGFAPTGGPARSPGAAPKGRARRASAVGKLPDALGRLLSSVPQGGLLLTREQETLLIEQVQAANRLRALAAQLREQPAPAAAASARSGVSATTSHSSSCTVSASTTGATPAAAASFSGRPATLADLAAAAGLEGGAAEVRRVLAQGDAARDELVRYNLRLVLRIAVQYRSRFCQDTNTSGGMALEDLVAVGVQGLHKGLARFDTSRGFKLSTYAFFWIISAMTELLGASKWAFHMPRAAMEQLTILFRARRRLIEQHGREPTHPELLLETGFSSRQYERITRLRFLSELSIDAPVSSASSAAAGPSGRGAGGAAQGTSGDKVGELGDLVEDPNGVDPLQSAEGSAMEAALTQLLERLPPKYSTVLARRYGLVCMEGEEGPRPAKNREIAEELGVSRGRVQQLQQEALHKLRRLAAEELSELSGVPLWRLALVNERSKKTSGARRDPRTGAAAAAAAGPGPTDETKAVAKRKGTVKAAASELGAGGSSTGGPRRRRAVVQPRTAPAPAAYA